MHANVANRLLREEATVHRFIERCGKVVFTLVPRCTLIARPPPTAAQAERCSKAEKSTSLSGFHPSPARTVPYLMSLISSLALKETTVVWEGPPPVSGFEVRPRHFRFRGPFPSARLDPLSFECTLHPVSPSNGCGWAGTARLETPSGVWWLAVTRGLTTCGLGNTWLYEITRRFISIQLLRLNIYTLKYGRPSA